MHQQCECGGDTYLCQGCGRIFCGREFQPTWTLMMNQDLQIFFGNLCPLCKVQLKQNMSILLLKAAVLAA
mgnify:CR=1 FL=1